MLCFWTLRYESWRAPTSNSYQGSHEVLAATWKEQVETCLAEWQEWRQNDVHERSDAFICRSYDGFARVAMSMGTNQLILGLYLGTNNCIFCSGQILNAKIWACRLGTSVVVNNMLCVILHLYNEPKISLCKVLPERGESTKSSKWSFESLLASLSRWIGMSPWCLYWISNYSHGDAAAGTCNVVHVSEVVVWNWFAGRTTWLATCWSRTRPWPLWFSLCFTLPLMLGLLGVLKFCFLKHSCVATVTASWIQSEKRNRAMSHVDIRCPPHRPSWPAG